MEKNVIYIDVEDDITSIIGKVKASAEPVVALVPPKRIGVLQSAVNLRLLSRAAKQSNKKLALVTNNQSLIALAGAAAIPVSKNLQSSPELTKPVTGEDDDTEDVIDGAELPIGEHAAIGSPSGRSAAVDSSAEMVATLAEAPKANEKLKKPKVKNRPSVPDFGKFRKKMIIIIVLAVLLIGFLIWAIFFAARATIVIKAKTNDSSINAPVSLTASGSTNFDRGTIKASVQQTSSDKSVDFAATGKKDAGSKATGTVTFSTDSITVARNGATIPAGTSLQSSSGSVFTTDSTVSISLSNPDGSTGVTAAENGSSYNAASGDANGAPKGVSASFDGPTSGGVTKNITVVTAADVQKAKQSLIDAGGNDQIKKDLTSKFPDGSTVADESFAVEYGDVTSIPAVGEEATGQAKLTTKVTYKLYGADKNQLDTYLDAYLKKQISGQEDQRVYKNGDDKVVFQDTKPVANGAQATLVATAKVGPKIDDNKVKDEVKGKKFGEIQQSIESIQGVESVDVKFFPFWVSTVPNDNAKVTVQFNLDDK